MTLLLADTFTSSRTRGVLVSPRPATWLYIFTKNSAFPLPLEEIAFLAGQAERGKRCYLMLAKRESPPLARAGVGDCVILCTREDGVLRKHGYGTVSVSAVHHDPTPEDVVPIYGQTSGRMFIELADVHLHDAQPVTELDAEAVAKFARGQAYVKRLSPEAPTPCAARDTISDGPAGPGSVVTEKRSLRAVGRDVVVIGLDPTAGEWDGRMTTGRKKMPSVCLVLRGSGHAEVAHGGVAWHATNDEFWQRVSDVGATTAAVDGPCATSGLRIQTDWDGWDLSTSGGIRDGERALSSAGVGLFWTTHATIARFDGASRWIARALRLFSEAEGRHGLTAIETHPHGAFVFLNKTLGGSYLEPKTSAAGRARRLAILQTFISGLSEQMLPDHDAVDAACAALVAALFVTGQVRSFGTAEGGGLIWMPEVDLERSQVCQQIIAVGRAGEAVVPPLLANEREAWRVVAGDREGWQRAAKRLSDADLQDLIRGLLLYARASGRMIGGSASPVITLYREVVSRAPAWEPALTAWIVEHRTNPYEPFGTGEDYAARSWAEYCRGRDGRDARRRAKARINQERARPE